MACWDSLTLGIPAPSFLLGSFSASSFLPFLTGGMSQRIRTGHASIAHISAVLICITVTTCLNSNDLNRNDMTENLSGLPSLPQERQECFRALQRVRNCPKMRRDDESAPYRPPMMTTREGAWRALWSVQLDVTVSFAFF